MSFGAWDVWQATGALPRTPEYFQKDEDGAR